MILREQLPVCFCRLEQPLAKHGECPVTTALHGGTKKVTLGQADRQIKRCNKLAGRQFLLYQTSLQQRDSHVSLHSLYQDGDVIKAGCKLWHGIRHAGLA